jgi:WhiB family redox-sensing transcriptional regulator
VVPEVDLDMFAVAHADDALVIDAREPYEYIAERVPGAKLAPVARLPHQADGLPATEPPHGPTRGLIMPATVTMATGQAGWRSLAACQHSDPELFFPISSYGPAEDQLRSAKAVCAQCQMREECLSFALDTGQDHGVWGGLSEEERRALRGRRAREASAPAG